jgi:hypothetical protein
VKRLKAKVRRVHNKRKLESDIKFYEKDTKTCWQPEQLHRKHFSSQYYEMEETAGQSSTTI